MTISAATAAAVVNAKPRPSRSSAVCATTLRCTLTTAQPVRWHQRNQPPCARGLLRFVSPIVTRSRRDRATTHPRASTYDVFPCCPLRRGAVVRFAGRSAIEQPYTALTTRDSGRASPWSPMMRPDESDRSPVSSGVGPRPSGVRARVREVDRRQRRNRGTRRSSGKHTASPGRDRGVPRLPTNSTSRSRDSVCSPFGGTTSRFEAAPTTGPTMSAVTPTSRAIANTRGLNSPIGVMPSARQMTTIGKRKSRKRCATGYKPREPATNRVATVAAKTKATGRRRFHRG